MATTTHFNLPKPDASKDVDEEFYQLQETLDLLDSILKGLQDAVNAKAASTHTHAISEVVNLATELAAKMPASQTFALDDLTNVSGAADAPNGYVLVQSALGWLPSSALAALGPHGHLIAEITGLVETLAGKVGVVAQSFTLGEQAQARMNIGTPEIFGQCYLTRTSDTLLTLSRMNGKFLTIAGIAREIPDEGVTLNVSGAVNSTINYIYAHMSGSTMTLEHSTTGHVRDTATGMRVKNGDSSRTLVGMAVPVASVWVDLIDTRYTLSYFNQRPKSLRAHGSGMSTTSTYWTNMSNGGLLYFLNWAGNAVHVIATASTYVNPDGSTGYIGIGVNGVAPGSGAGERVRTQSGYWDPATVSKVISAGSDAVHYTALYGFIISGGTSFGAFESSMRATVMG